MSTLALILSLALTGQLAGSGGNAGAGGRYPIGGDQSASAASPNTVVGQTAGGTTAQPNSVTSPATQGPPGNIGSAYAVGGNALPGGAAASPINNPLGRSYSPAGTQSTQPLTGIPGGISPMGAAPSGQLGSPRESNDRIGTTSRNDDGLTPAAMMRAMLAEPPNSRLPGEWIALESVVAGAPSRSEQTARVEAYWDLCSSLADYYLGLREQEELRRLRQAMPSASGSLDQAERQLAVRVGTAERGARACQFRLAALIGYGADRLPLPAHPPHCGSYQTRHEQVFAGRRSAEADELNQLISLRYAELEAECAAVNRSEDWLRNAAASPGAADEATLVRALELLALERRAFVQIARDYNRRIARYAELAAPGQVGSDKLIGMLIKRDPAATAIRPSSTPGLDRRSQTGAAGQPTFAGGAGGWVPVEAANPSTVLRDEAVTPISAEEPPTEPIERSLLVPRR